MTIGNLLVLFLAPHFFWNVRRTMHAMSVTKYQTDKRTNGRTTQNCDTFQRCRLIIKWRKLVVNSRH